MNWPRLLLVSELVWASWATSWAEEVPFELGEWQVEGRGNHRALVQVDEPGDAVWVRIPWRRRDPNAQEKDVRIFDAQTKERITNLVRINVTQEFGDLVFQPTSGAGLYEVYYLPYEPPKQPTPGGWWKAWYFKPEETADPEWRKRNGLTDEALATGEWQKWPQAKVTAIQARTEFDRFDPMEVIATKEEVAQLLARYPQRNYLLFPEDRRLAIKMFEHLPHRWVKGGASKKFFGQAQPGEFFVFQLGIFAARKPVTDLQLEFSDLRGEGKRRVPAGAFRCFNLTGVDWLGRPIRKTFSVAVGRVRPLWIGIQVPKEAKGKYVGTIKVKPKELEEMTVSVELTVDGAVLEDFGDSDNWRLSRLRWLDSKIGLEDEIVPPFTPIKVRGHTVQCLGRQVRFGQFGLPESINSNGREILSSPVRFIVDTESGHVAFKPLPQKWRKRNDAVAEWEVTAPSDDCDLWVHTKMEFDGCITNSITLRAKRAMNIRDIRLEMPIQKEVAVYMMGMGWRGGKRPKEWRWEWEAKRPNNMVWIGDWEAGVQLKLVEARDVWHGQVIDFKPPRSWDNDGRGGCHMAEEDEAFGVRAFTGERRMAKGEQLEFLFRFLITPFKPLDKKRWHWRYGGGGNIVHLHHGSKPANPYINYPISTWRELTEFVRAMSQTPLLRNLGVLTYPAEGNLDPSQGSLHLWVRVNFDPQAGQAGDARFNQSLFGLTSPNDDAIGFYWNIDDRGMRAYVRKGSPHLNQYPVLIGSHQPDWEKGQVHIVTLSWGKHFAIFVDGKLAAQANYQGTTDAPLKDALMQISGSGFIVRAIKISQSEYVEGTPIEFAPDENCLLLDTFSKVQEGRMHPEKMASGKFGMLTGRFELRQRDGSRELSLIGDPMPVGVNIYYTVRELTNHTPELWALRGLGDEILEPGGVDIYNDPKAQEKFSRVGHPWLHEHLVSGYVPGWMHPFSETDVCSAIAMKGLSRWHNFYVEGLRFLMERTGVDGIYLDGIGYDREVMKRVRRVMKRINPNSRIDFHSGDNWAPPWEPEPPLLSPANEYMEHFPYLDTLWFGELFDYNMPPDYWLVEISGIPFGLMGDMLNYENGGNPYRGMIYGMTGRFHPCTPSLWQALDAFGIDEAEMMGYWRKDCPVRTDHPDVLATVYRKPGKALIAVAHFVKSRERKEAKVCPTTTALAIDGHLSEGEWEKAARLTHFVLLGEDKLAEQPTEVFVTYDERNLYIGFRCIDKYGQLKAEARKRDDTVWEDDAVESFIQPDLEKPVYFQFIGNSEGMIADGRGMDLSWDGDWTYKASVGQGFWEGELCIPFATLGMASPVEGQEIGFNACRDQQTPAPVLSSWSATSGTFHNPSAFGLLTFSTTGEPTRQEPPSAMGTIMNVHLQIDWKAIGIDPQGCRLLAPSIYFFQPYATFSPTEAIPVERGKGWLLVVERGPRRPLSAARRPTAARAASVVSTAAAAPGTTTVRPPSNSGP